MFILNRRAKKTHILLATLSNFYTRVTLFLLADVIRSTKITLKYVF